MSLDSVSLVIHGPDIPAGQIAAELNHVVLLYRILHGLAPNAAGLHQINVVVPSVPSNVARFP